MSEKREKKKESARGAEKKELLFHPQISVQPLSGTENNGPVRPRETQEPGIIIPQLRFIELSEI